MSLRVAQVVPTSPPEAGWDRCGGPTATSSACFRGFLCSHNPTLNPNRCWVVVPEGAYTTSPSWLQLLSAASSETKNQVEVARGCCPCWPDRPPLVAALAPLRPFYFSPVSIGCNLAALA